MSKRVRPTPATGSPAIATDATLAFYLGEMSWERPRHVSNGMFVPYGRPYGVRARANVFRSHSDDDVANVSFLLVATVVAAARRRRFPPYVFHTNACAWHLCINE